MRLTSCTIKKNGCRASSSLLPCGACYWQSQVCSDSLFLFAATELKKLVSAKVNGATIAEVVTMLNRDIVRWVLVAFCFGYSICLVRHD